MLMLSLSNKFSKTNVAILLLKSISLSLSSLKFYMSNVSAYRTKVVTNEHKAYYN